MNTPPSSIEPDSWRCWVAAARPRTLTMACVPVIVGTVLAASGGAAPNGGVFALTLLVAVLIQVATNLHNDASDALGGVDDAATRLGPPRAVASGWLTADAVLRAAKGSLLAAFLLGLLLVAVGGWPILAIGLTAMLAAWAYSAGPAPISSAPVGELFVLAFFGLAAVAGAYYLQAGSFSAAAWLAGVVIGLPAAAVLLVNNHRDRESDAHAGRFTLAIMIGPGASCWLFAAMLAASCLLATLLVSASHVRLPLLLLPWALWLAWRLFAGTGVALNGVLAGTSLFQVALGTLLCVSWIVGS